MVITDLVKFYLFPDDHIANCRDVNVDIEYVNTHYRFKQIARERFKWLKEEILLCNPKIIITLGEVRAREVSGDKDTPVKELLSVSLRPLQIGSKLISIAHLGHQEIFRRDAGEWRKHVIESLYFFFLFTRGQFRRNVRLSPESSWGQFHRNEGSICPE